MKYLYLISMISLGVLAMPIYAAITQNVPIKKSGSDCMWSDGLWHPCKTIKVEPKIGATDTSSKSTATTTNKK